MPLGRDAGLARAAQLAFADHIGAGALGREQPQHREPVVRLHRVVDVRIQSGVGQRAGEHAIASAHGGRRIDPDRRADVIGDGIQRHVVDQQPVHRMHRECGRAAISSAAVGSGVSGVEDSGHGVIRVYEVESRDHSSRSRRLRSHVTDRNAPVHDPAAAIERRPGFVYLIAMAESWYQTLSSSAGPSRRRSDRGTEAGHNRSIAMVDRYHAKCEHFD